MRLLDENTLNYAFNKQALEKREETLPQKRRAISTSWNTFDVNLSIHTHIDTKLRDLK